jgi:hypothetical protein
MQQQQQTRPHPELANGVAWMPVSLQTPPPPPPKPAPIIPPIAYPVAGALLILLGYLIAGETRSWQSQHLQQQNQQLQQQNQQLQQDKARYCQGGGQ